jgi:hypothetical protein
MPLYQNASAPSEARTRLRNLIAGKVEAQKSLAEAQTRIDALGAIAEALGPIRAKLSKLDGDDARAFADWSMTPTDPVPVADIATRAQLQAELADAMAQSQAAERAIGGVRADADAKARKVSAIHGELDFAAAIVALEEAADLEVRAKAAMAEFEAARAKVGIFLDVIDRVRLGKQTDAPMWSEYTAAFVDAQQRLLGAFNGPAPNEGEKHDFQSKLETVLRDLREDAGTRLHL